MPRMAYIPPALTPLPSPEALADQDVHDLVTLTPVRAVALSQESGVQRVGHKKVRTTKAERENRDRLLLRLWHRHRDTRVIADVTGYTERHVQRVLSKLLD